MEINVTDYYQHHVDQALSGNYKIHGDLAAVDCVIGASFGYIQQGDAILPGLSNQDLAAFVAELFNGIPKILQFEIADAYESHRPNKDQLHRIEKARTAGQRLDTPELIIQSHKLMNQHGWKVAAIVAHPNHLPWVDYLCEQMNITTVTPAGLANIRFDPDSEQYWTRSLEAWQQEVRQRHQAGDPRKPTNK